MRSHARVVIIGGGVVGCSVLYHLSRLGWTDAMLVERSEITSGSTWHAAHRHPAPGAVVAPAPRLAARVPGPYEGR